MAKPLKIGIIGGSGLDNPDILKNRNEKRVCTPYGKPSDTLILGDIDNVPCVLLARHGRLHNINPSNVNYRANIWALREEGCRIIIATNATGSLQEDIRQGDIVVLDNFIDRTSGRQQTFYDGEPDHPYGVCHLPMEPPYSEFVRRAIIDAAAELKIDVHKTGTVIGIEGPRFSSKAESNLFRSWGGHVINMTAVPEVILAKEAGICYAAIAIATDYDCWKDTGERVCVTEVVKTFKKNINKIVMLILATVPKLASRNWQEPVKELQALIQESFQNQ